MTSLKQIAANRLYSFKSTGPRTQEGKQRSRCNALRHGLTAETVVTALESAADYQAYEAVIAADYGPCTATEREVVSRLASVLWRLRRSTSIETGLFQIQGELMRSRNARSRRRGPPLPEWYDELDVAPSISSSSAGGSDRDTFEEAAVSPQELSYCFLQVSRLQYGAFDLLPI